MTGGGATPSAAGEVPAGGEKAGGEVPTPGDKAGGEVPAPGDKAGGEVPAPGDKPAGEVPAPGDKPAGGAGAGGDGVGFFPPGEYASGVPPIDFAFAGEPDPKKKPDGDPDIPEEIVLEEQNIIDGGGDRDPSRQGVVLEGSAVSNGDASLPFDPGEPVPGGAYVYVAPDLQILFKGLGSLGADAVEIQVFGVAPGEPLRLSTDGLIVEPVRLEAEVKQRLEREVRRLAAANPLTARLSAYCVEFLRLPPELGTVFRVAPPEVQAQYSRMRDVLTAGRRLHEAGLLHPDSDPEAYFHSTRQWAIWALQEQLDADSYARNFLEHTRKNFQAAGRPWTPEVEELVESYIPNRWRDIVSVLQESTKESREREDETVEARP